MGSYTVRRWGPRSEGGFGCDATKSAIQEGPTTPDKPHHQDVSIGELLTRSVDEEKGVRGEKRKAEPEKR
jgi:hypothetical protein